MLKMLKVENYYRTLSGQTTFLQATVREPLSKDCEPTNLKLKLYQGLRFDNLEIEYSPSTRASKTALGSTKSKTCWQR